MYIPSDFISPTHVHSVYVAPPEVPTSDLECVQVCDVCIACCVVFMHTRFIV